MEAMICPVCLGRGHVRAGFYTASYMAQEAMYFADEPTEECQSCKGQGWVVMPCDQPSQLCPVCNGTGTYRTTPTADGSGHLEYRCHCHGCGGKGWVEVSEEQPRS